LYFIQLPAIGRSTPEQRRRNDLATAGLGSSTLRDHSGPIRIAATAGVAIPWAAIGQ
jgi:hypothetical protein